MRWCLPCCTSEKDFAECVWVIFLSCPFFYPSAHPPAINRIVYSIKESLAQMTATVDQKSWNAQTKLSLSASVICWARKGTVFFGSVRACLCQRGHVILEQEEHLSLSPPTAWLCNSCNSQTRRWGSAPFLFFLPPSLSLYLLPPSACARDRDSMLFGWRSIWSWAKRSDLTAGLRAHFLCSSHMLGS